VIYLTLMVFFLMLSCYFFTKMARILIYCYINGFSKAEVEWFEEGNRMTVLDRMRRRTTSTSTIHVRWASTWLFLSTRATLTSTG
jgi:hypothetical protein